MSKYLLSFLLVLPTALAMAGETAADWLQVRSGHITVVTNSGEKRARRIAGELERMRAILLEAYPQLQSEGEAPVIVLAIKDKKVFRSLEPEAYLSKHAMRLHGLFVGGAEKKYILMRLDAEAGNPYAVAYHEYTHVLLSQADDSMPLWLNEGLAEFYGNTEIHDSNVLLGEPDQRHFMRLREQTPLPLASLFTVDEESPYYIEEKKASVFYAEAWALTHYLMLKDYQEKTRKVGEYSELVDEKVDPVTAAVRVFGDLKKLQRALDAYIDQRSFNHFETKMPVRIDESEFAVERIGPVQAKAVEADFLACDGRAEQARALLQEVWQQDPRNASAHETLAVLDAAAQEQREHQLLEDVRLNPSLAAAFDRLATFYWKGDKNLEEASALESKAVSLDGANIEYRITLARILLRVGRPQSAARVLEDATKAAGTPEESEAMGELLADARRSAAEQTPEQAEVPAEKSPAERRSSNGEQGFVTKGPHRFAVGVLKGVHCEPPNLELTVASRSQTLTLQAENFYKIQFTALFTPTGELEPCNDLEDRLAKVEYVESADATELPRLIAVELRK